MEFVTDSAGLQLPGLVQIVVWRMSSQGSERRPGRDRTLQEVGKCRIYTTHLVHLASRLVTQGTSLGCCSRL